MCGICGIKALNGKRIDIDELRKMNSLLIHRGPDEEGFYIEDEIGLASRRLSIIDLKTGTQPLFNETKDIVVVFNGEIYNFLDIKKELLEKGHIFKTNSDTEVIVHLYEEEGVDFPKKLRGMFAIALWDNKNKRLLLVRDRIGKKPLFYYIDNNYFVFSSEINSLISFKDIKKTINLKAINIYLTLQYIPSPLTIYNEIKKLEQATILVFEKNQIKKIRYWELPYDEKKMDFEEAKLRLKKLLTESVKLRMIADVDVGAFLSGGIDSSIIVALMSQNSTKKIKTFSIGFKEEKYNELDYAKEVSSYYSTEHFEFIVEDKMTDIVDNIPLIYNQPFADPSALPTFIVSKITSKNLKVALNGDGGDECFGGYTRYLAIKKIEEIKKLNINFLFRLLYHLTENFKENSAPFGKVWLLRKFLKTYLKDNIEKSYLSTVSFFDVDEKNQLLTDSFKYIFKNEPEHAEKFIIDLMKKYEKKDIVNRISATDIFSYLSEGLMTKMDMASMANSLETRSPFLDHKVIEFSQQIPGDYKIKGKTTKYILKEVFKELLPPKIRKRGKMGFGIPLGIWFKGELKRKFEENCLSDDFFKRGYFKKEEIQKLWFEHQSGKRDHGYKLWTILILELWHKKYAKDFKL